MANVGDLVLYNENANGVVSAAYGTVVMTDTSWSPDAAAAMGDGNYPAQPATGQVLIAYWSCVGQSLPTPAAAYAVAGTGVGEYQALG